MIVNLFLSTALCKGEQIWGHSSAYNPDKEGYRGYPKSPQEFFPPDPDEEEGNKPVSLTAETAVTPRNTGIQLRAESLTETEDLNTPEHELATARATALAHHWAANSYLGKDTQAAAAHRNQASEAERHVKRLENMGVKDTFVHHKNLMDGMSQAKFSKLLKEHKEEVKTHPHTLSPSAIHGAHKEYFSHFGGGQFVQKQEDAMWAADTAARKKEKNQSSDRPVVPPNNLAQMDPSSGEDEKTNHGGMSKSFPLYISFRSFNESRLF